MARLIAGVETIWQVNIPQLWKDGNSSGEIRLVRFPCHEWQSQNLDKRRQVRVRADSALKKMKPLAWDIWNLATLAMLFAMRGKCFFAFTVVDGFDSDVAVSTIYSLASIMEKLNQ